PAVKILVGGEIIVAFFLQAVHKLFVRLDGTQRSLEIFERQDKRLLAATVGRSEKNVQIRAIAFGQLFISPSLRRPAAMKVDVRRDNRLGSRSVGVGLWQSGTAR